MIIDKIHDPFSEEEREKLHNITYKVAVKEELTEEEKSLEKKYFNMLAEYGRKRYEYALSFNGNKAAILSDAREILTAVEKADFQEYMSKPRNKEMLEHLGDFGSCYSFLVALLCDQLMACNCYELDDHEVYVMAKNKAAEWYEMPKDFNVPPPKRKSSDKKKLKELPKVQKTATPEKYFLPTYKLVDTLFSGTFPIGEEKMVNMASEKDNRKGKIAYTLMMLNFDELGDGIKISRELSVYDQQVWNACVNLMLNGYRIITPSQIYKWMGYESTMGKTEKDRIMESINTIIRARVFIDNENERQLYKRYPEISLNTPLLAAKIITAKSGKNEVTAIEMLEIPDLFTIAEERGQITTIPFEVLEKSAIDKTENNLQLLTYLTRRIIYMKHDSDTSRKILLQAIYAKCNIENYKQRQRLPDKLKRVFDRYTEIRWINGYELTDKEIIVKLPAKN